MEVSGTVKLVNEVKQITPTLRKGELVITTEEAYPQTLMIEFVNDRAELLNNIKPGERVSVSINLRGREWNSPSGEIKYFVSLSGWKIAQGSSGDSPAAPPQAPSAAASSYGSGFADNSKKMGEPEMDDDLPF